MASCSIIISWFRLGFQSSPTLLASCSIIIVISWFWLGFRGLSPYSSGALFHHPFLVPARVPGLVAQTGLALDGVRNSFKKDFCSTMILWFRLFWHSVPSSFPQSFWFRVGFRGLSPQCSGILFHHHVQVPSGSRKGCGACLPGVVALCSIMISSFLLVPARVPGLVSLLFFSFLSFLRKRIVFHRGFWLLLVPGSGSGGCLPSFLSFLFSGMGRPMNSLLRMNVVETWFVAVWGLCWCIFFLKFCRQ